ncbi:MAG TPA: glycosyltransferase [Dongiaceae bacterium]|nr:glycosyltransferase [Dongiaceae bacterium]
MHIMHVIDSLHKGGAERMLVDIANQTVAAGERASVVITRQGADLAGELAADIQITCLDRQQRFDRRANRQFAVLLHEQRPDVLHAHGRSTFAYLALLKTLRQIRVPILLHDHYGKIEMDASVPAWFRWWGRHLISQYVGVCAALGDWARSAGVASEKVAVIGNAINLNRVREATGSDLCKELGLPEAGKVGLVVAGIRPEKGIEPLLEAAAQARKQQPFCLIVAGGNRDEEYGRACRARRDALGLKDIVVFAGERADVPRLIRGVDFAVMPSLSESGPLVLIEFMAGGLPFVATLVGEISRQVARRSLPEFVAPGDVPALAEALARLLALAPNDWQERGERGKVIAREFFDIQTVWPQWRQVYQRMLGAATA